MSEDLLKEIFESHSYEIRKFEKNEIVFSPETHQRKIGFIVKGECEVLRLRCDQAPLPLKNLPPYASFGILSILSEDEYPTEIKAIKSTTVLFIKGEEMLSIIEKYPKVAMNVISFLAQRVTFLNRKMATFSEKSTAQKLASYLLMKYNQLGSEFSISRTKISAEISVGRASLYRDMEALEKENLIKSDQKKIIIIDPEGLERKIK